MLRISIGGCGQMDQLIVGHQVHSPSGFSSLRQFMLLVLTQVHELHMIVFSIYAAVMLQF